MVSNDHLGVTSSTESAQRRREWLSHVDGSEEVCNSKTTLPLEERAKPAERIGSAMLILRSRPTSEEWNNIVAATKNGIALTGTAAERPAGPVIGLVDIGTCDDAYLFRMSLPGVSRDAGNFSCEIETNGRVLVKGITLTGEKTICKNSYIFQMQTQYLCSPGHFSVSFQLPGPVDHRGFSATFGTDGIFEGVVLKRDWEDHDKALVLRRDWEDHDKVRME